MALEHMHPTERLDYTIKRLAVVYGAHHHEIQGFHCLLFSLVDESMTVLPTRRGAGRWDSGKAGPEWVAPPG